MKKILKKCLGFRSGTPWKMILAVIYYVMCLAFLIIGMVTPPLVPAGKWDTFVVKLSTFVLFLEMLSPAIFLSDTPLRDALPLFRKRVGMWSLVGMMIAFVLFQYLFMATESLHTAQYHELFNVYINSAFAGFVEAGGG